MNEAHGFDRLGTAESGRHGAFLGAHFTTDFVAMQKNTVGAGMAQDIDARIAGDRFRAIAPENNFSLQVEHAHADLQAVKDIGERGPVKSRQMPELQRLRWDGTLATAQWHESAICKDRPQVYFRR
jgi:hypothetical protein